ncbi:MAG TPA: methyltransferase, partial [Rhizobiaceae bacterium]|nr:methyltransferase [Rhizobiaceae bacterium]
QPLKSGHRAGSDALLLAAARPAGASGIVADLGAGAGVAGLAAITMNEGLEAVLVEIDPVMASCARQTLELPVNSGLAGRAQVIEADIRLTGARRRQTGLADAAYDFVIANPPYYSQDERPSPDERRKLAHVMEEGGLEAWMRTAAAILKPRGVAFFVWRPQQLNELLEAAKGRFGGLQILPLHARGDAPAGRIIVRATRGSRAPLVLLPGIVLHEADGKPTQTAQLLLNGKARLNWA